MVTLAVVGARDDVSKVEKAPIAQEKPQNRLAASTEVIATH